MKIFIKTTVEITLPFSRIDDVYRVTGTPSQIQTLLSDPKVTLLSNGDFLTLFPNLELMDCDVPDVEVDDIAVKNGIDPALKTDIKIPKGKYLLQEQENYLLSLVSERKGITKTDWDILVTSTKWNKGKNLENDVLAGKTDAHEFIISKLR